MAGGDALCMMTAGEALAAFRARRLSPVELMQAVIARAERVNPALNAFTYTFFERALDRARRAEAKYLKTDGRPRPLEGVPIAIKDLHPVKGEITTFGSKAFADHRPDHTAPAVARLLRAGAIMHGRTTTPEAPSGTTSSPLWGVTRNPWNAAYSPGGSSGGAGAALATGMTVLADGTDAGGSIRIPASACGLVGYKPPFGRNPLDRDFPRESILQYGPLSRAVGDAALMQNVMSGPHPDDPCSLRTRVRIPKDLAGIEGWRVALSLDLGYVTVDSEVERNTRAAADVFRDLGCVVDEVALGWHSGVLDAFLTHTEAVCAGLSGPLLPRWRYEMDPFLVDVIERGMRLDAARGLSSQSRAERDVPHALTDPRPVPRIDLSDPRAALGADRAQQCGLRPAHRRDTGAAASRLAAHLPVQPGERVSGDERPERLLCEDGRADGYPDRGPQLRRPPRLSCKRSVRAGEPAATPLAGRLIRYRGDAIAYG